MRGSLYDTHPLLKLLLAFMFSLGFTIVFTILGLGTMPLWFNIGFDDVMLLAEDPFALGVGPLEYLQSLYTIGAYLVPAFLLAHLFSFEPSRYLEIDEFPRRGGLIVFLVLILTLSGSFISDWLYNFSETVVLPDFMAGVKEMFDVSGDAAAQQMEIFLTMESFQDFVKIFLILAVLPAICEETLFRGVLQPVLKEWVKYRWLAIAITSLLFALLHMQFYALLSIFTLSIVLGYLKEWSNSLWVPVLMHVFNNGAIVVAVYFFDMDVNTAGSWDVIYTIIATAVFGGVLLLINRLLRK